MFKTDNLLSGFIRISVRH